MRKQAALLTLHLTESSLQEGIELKDASPYNVLFDGCAPSFIDLGSFRAGYSGHWPGYGQFGDHFMNPLLVEAHAGVRTSDLNLAIDGLSTGTARRLLKVTHLAKAGTWAWIWRRGLAERIGGRAGEGAGTRLGESQLPQEAVKSILAKAERTILRLESRQSSQWAAYVETALPYATEESRRKRELVGYFLEEASPRTVLDVGTNTGEFAELAAATAERVIAVDSDSRAIDRLFTRGIRSDWGSRVTPAVVDISQPTPSYGWRGLERSGFLDRIGTVDLSLWLAVLHHLMLSSGIPIDEILSLVKETSRRAVIEYIAPDDPSVRTMTAGRRWATVPDRTSFAAALSNAGLAIDRREPVNDTRDLLLVTCA